MARRKKKDKPKGMIGHFKKKKTDFGASHKIKTIASRPSMKTDTVGGFGRTLPGTQKEDVDYRTELHAARREVGQMLRNRRRLRL